LDVYAIHLASPPSRRQAAQRIRQLDALGALLRDADPAVPLVVAGDFNLTPFSPYFGDLLQPTGLRDARRPFGLHATWPAWPLPLWIPIDHCLVGARTRAVRVATGPTTGSDHWPLECDLVP
jgi:endonuclease/exonuclease/phosphatase family metal-dependent hydrolase